MTPEERSKSRVSWLTVPEFFRLDYCCQGLFQAFGTPPYLVGSCTGLRIDFKFQDTTQANTKHKGVRNPLGLRDQVFGKEKAQVY